MRFFNIGVIGPSDPDDEIKEIAYRIGKLIAEKGWVLVTGGKGGVMEEASRGALDGGGITVGIIPEEDPDSANPFVKIVIPTGMGEMRNILIVRMADALISIGYSYGTLIEIATAFKLGKFLVSLNAPESLPFPLRRVNSPEEALRKIEVYMEGKG
jgi:hypothetical protein